MSAVKRNKRAQQAPSISWDVGDMLLFATMLAMDWEALLKRAGLMKDRNGATDWINIRQCVDLIINDCKTAGLMETNPADSTDIAYPTAYSNGVPVYETDWDRGEDWVRLNHPSGTPVEVWQKLSPVGKGGAV